MSALFLIKQAEQDKERHNTSLYNPAGPYAAGALGLEG